MQNQICREFFSSLLKQKLDAIFIFDMLLPLTQSITKSVRDAKSKARSIIDKEFGSPISDVAGYGLRHSQLNEAEEVIKDSFKISQEGNLAKVVLETAKSSQTSLKKNFDINVEFESETIEKLQMISDLYSKGPIAVTENLIALTEGS